jgi:hypothetical protein
MSADVSELLQYANQVEHVVDHIEPDLSRAVERGALNVKRSAVQTVHAFSRGLYLKHYPKSISYDMISPLEAEIGPDKSMRQGGMGRGVEFGSVHTPPLPHMFPALDVEQPRFERQIAPILARGLR